MGFLFNIVASAGVGFATTALVIGTGPIGLALLIAKGAEIGLVATLYGVAAAGATNSILNGGNPVKELGEALSDGRRGLFPSNGPRDRNNGNSAGGSRDPNDGNNAGDSNDPDKSDPGESSDSDVSLSSDEDSWDSSDETDERNHRYKYIDKRYPGRSTYPKPLEIDHTVPMDVWQKLLAEIKKYAEKDLPKHLKRALKIFRIILKNKDVYSLSPKDLKKLMKEFPAIEILKLIHRYQFSTGNKELQRKFNQLILDYILAGNWDKAIEYIFIDQYKIAKFFDVDQEEIENILERQRSFVRYLLRKGIITDEEARKLLDVINNLTK